jgi:hypothetical protein
MSESLIYHRNLIKLSIAINKLDEILLIWHLDLVSSWDLFKENIVSFIFRHFNDCCGLLYFCIVIGGIRSWDIFNKISSLFEQILTLNCSSSSNTHIFSFIFGFCKSMNCQHLPSTCLKVKTVILENTAPLTIFKRINCIVLLRRQKCLIEVLTNLQGCF